MQLTSLATVLAFAIAGVAALPGYAPPPPPAYAPPAPPPKPTRPAAPAPPPAPPTLNQQSVSLRKPVIPKALADHHLEHLLQRFSLLLLSRQRRWWRNYLCRGYHAVRLDHHLLQQQCSGPGFCCKSYQSLNCSDHPDLNSRLPLRSSQWFALYADTVFYHLQLQNCGGINTLQQPVTFNFAGWS